MPHKLTRKQRIQIRLATTLLGWGVAFLIAYALLFFFGKQLASLPTALHALLFTGILVTIMGNVFMPAITTFVVSRISKK